MILTAVLIYTQVTSPFGSEPANPFLCQITLKGIASFNFYGGSRKEVGNHSGKKKAALRKIWHIEVNA